MHVTNAKPLPEHKWLQRLVGDWTVVMEASMGCDQPPSKSEMTESVRAIGDVWVQCEGRAPLGDGTPMTNIMTLGYDPALGKFVGTFIGSVMTYQWVYSGTLAGDVLTLDADGPDFAVEGKMAKYQDAIEFKSDDYRILTSQTLGADGKWNRFMTAHYRRVKS